MEDGVTRLLSKVAGIPRVSELRPITLLQTDYKILTRILAKRLIKVLPEIIRSGQSCSVKDMGIQKAVFKILSTLEYIEKNNLKAAMVSLDQEKAFDRVMIRFLEQTMEKMNFPKRWIEWIRLFHKDCTTRFLLGDMSREVKVSFSLRQGDPLSMVFIWCL